MYRCKKTERLQFSISWELPAELITGTATLSLVQEDRQAKRVTIQVFLMAVSIAAFAVTHFILILGSSFCRDFSGFFMRLSMILSLFQAPLLEKVA